MRAHREFTNIVADGSAFSQAATSVLGGNLGKTVGSDDASDYERQIMELISFVRRTWTGWAVLSAIYQLKSRKLYVTPNLRFNPQSLSMQRDARGGAMDPKGGSAKGSWLRNCDPYSPRAGHAIGGKGLGTGSDGHITMTPEEWGNNPPAYRVFLHEIVHAFRGMAGFSECLPAYEYRTYEEFLAIVIENMFISEFGNYVGMKFGYMAQPANAYLQRHAKYFIEHKTTGGVAFNRWGLEKFRKDHLSLFQTLRRGRAPWNPLIYV